MFNTACSNKAALLATLSNRVCTLLVLVRLSCVLSSLHALLDLLWRVLLQPSAPLAPSVSILRACVSLCVRVGGTLHTCSKACIGRTPLSLSPDSSLWCRKLAFLSVVSALLQPSTTSLPLCLPLCSCTERSLAPSATCGSRLAPAPAARRGTWLGLGLGLGLGIGLGLGYRVRVRVGFRVRVRLALGSCSQARHSLVAILSVVSDG